MKFILILIFCIIEPLNAMDDSSKKDTKQEESEQHQTPLVLTQELEKVLFKKIFSAGFEIAAKFKEDHKNCTNPQCLCKFKSSSATNTNE